MRTKIAALVAGALMLLAGVALFHEAASSEPQSPGSFSGNGGGGNGGGGGW